MKACGTPHSSSLSLIWKKNTEKTLESGGIWDGKDQNRLEGRNGGRDDEREERQKDKCSYPESVCVIASVCVCVCVQGCGKTLERAQLFEAAYLQ